MFCYCRCCCDSLAALLLSSERFLSQPLFCGTVFHHTSLLLPLFPPSAVVLNHISLLTFLCRFLTLLSIVQYLCSDSSLWTLYRYYILSMHDCMCVRLFAMSCSCPVSSFHSESIQTQQEVSKVFAVAQHRG